MCKMINVPGYSLQHFFLTSKKENRTGKMSIDKKLLKQITIQTYNLKRCNNKNNTVIAKTINTMD